MLNVDAAPTDCTPLDRLLWRQQERSQRILVLSSYSRSLTNFRLELLKSMVRAGHVVVAAGPEDDPDVKSDLSKIGVEFARIPMARASLSPVRDIATFFQIRRLIKKIRPDVVVPYTMKPIVYGGIAARSAGVPRRCFLVTGLGHVFSDASLRTLKGRWIKRLCVWLYRLAMAGAKAVFVYNDADRSDIIENSLVHDVSVIHRVAGSGVDVDHYAFAPAPFEKPVFLMVTRLIKDKGVFEYVEAARRLKQHLPNAEFQLLGPFDPNPGAISRLQVQEWIEEGVVDYLGETNDVRPFLAKCNIFVLPSYYREGIPRSILEAMAVGRAIITTDLPGCRDTIEPGENGYLVMPRSADSLFSAMSPLADRLRLAAEMGRRSRELACTRFDVHSINETLIDRMGLSNHDHASRKAAGACGREARQADAINQQLDATGRVISWRG
ncbi:glycosyltransferase involved in cell wall biosynthesis [Rhizobium mongolense USDA 1844]|uniref:Glycosyltransferase involved in cell wall biosynthesis n=1 Tax=Rhizobium mongolense USDA 1844 TaxID=1079460 RepID=A0A559TE77_9HYPH|nr:glycosyltransferase involved in cell wall biosynthesis [Rhizobium mongolense USDA 1844]